MTSRDSDASYHEESEPFSEEEDEGDKKPAAKPTPVLSAANTPNSPVLSAYQAYKNSQLPREEWRKSWEAYQHKVVFNTPINRLNVYLGPAVDFHNLAGRQWGKDSAFRYLPIPEIDSLVGWATHLSHNGVKDARNNLVAQPQQQGNNTPQKGVDPNPLLGIQPDGPLPHSHMDTLIHDKARNIIRGRAPGIPKEEADQYECVVESCDTSALVAMGMVLEEAITANLLPLAEYHVQRCRALEQQEEEYELQQEAAGILLPLQYERESFHQWTLPPEEAILNIMESSVSASQTANNTGKNVIQDGGRGLLPTACHPTLSIHAGTQSNPHQDSKTEAALQQHAAGQWCDQQQLQRKVVRKNMDLFHWFVPTKPAANQPSWKKRKAATAAATPATGKRKKAPPGSADKKKSAAKSKSGVAKKSSTGSKAKSSPAKKKTGTTSKKEESFLTKLSRDLLLASSSDDEE